MTSLCPRCGAPAAGEYCDQCGTRLAPPPADATLTLSPDAAEHSLAAATASHADAPPTVCPRCGTPRAGDDRFCEGCGFDFVSGSTPAAPYSPTPALEARWEAVVAADRAYFDRLAPIGVDFPTGYQPRTFVLDGAELRIGRHSPSRNARPEIDLAGAVEDPGISRLHAVLTRVDEGRYAVVDVGSTNGTTVNEEEAPIPAHVPYLLREGDRVHLGAWTTITIRMVPGSGDHP